MNLTRKDFMLAALGTAGTLAVGCGDDTTGGGGGSGGSSSGGGSEGGAPEGGAPAGGAPAGGAPAGGAPEGGSGEGGATGGAPAGGSGEGGGTPQLTCTETIGTNHGHTIEVSSGDVAAGADKTYDITGTSQHSHSVTVTAAQFASLGNGEQVVITSTSGNQHTHQVTIVCV